MLINNTIQDSTLSMHHSDAVDFICIVCPFKLSNKKTFENHSKRMHNGRNNQIRFVKFTRNISEVIQSQCLKPAKFSICGEEFSYTYYMAAHMEETHNSREIFWYLICDEGFFKLRFKYPCKEKAPDNS